MATHETFVAIIREVWLTSQPELERLATAAQQMRADPHWFWNVLINSFCTSGGSANLAQKRAEYGLRLSWDEVIRMRNGERAALFADLPNRTRRDQITPAIQAAFDKLCANGGPIAFAQQYATFPDADECLAFLQEFEGIGMKYSRNIAMDIYDERILDHAALDWRLNKILDCVDGAPPKSSYHDRENYLRGVRVEAQLPNMWFLDRLLYGYYAEIMAMIDAQH